MNDLPVPDKKLSFQIYLKLLVAYQERCAKSGQMMEKAHLEKLIDESIKHAQLFEKVYFDAINKAYGLSPEP